MSIFDSRQHPSDGGPTHAGVISRIAQQLEQLQLNGQSDAHTTIQTGEINEANPWLRRTQRAQYLQGINRGALSKL
jgi:hypothetical protein